ncbi:transglutaminase family protein [Hydrogenimonas sp.]
MRFSKRWRSTESPAGGASPLRLLDIAYLTVLPPLLLVLKLPMLLFVTGVILLILSGRKPTPVTQITVAIVGFAAIFLSLYGAFSFVGLSRLKLFVELLTYLLLLAVSLQRLTGKIDLYLAISPMLLVALSLFFFDTIPMLLYLIFEIFVLLWMVLTWRMRTTPMGSLRMAGTLFLLSLPLVVVLFIFFPRVSFGHASYGFRGESLTRMGHDGTMRLDAGALDVLSHRIVMEVGFEGKIPPENLLYFRGSVLYLDRKDHWEPLPSRIVRRIPPNKYALPPMYEEADDIVVYKVSLYPTRKRWLYMLDLPFEAPDGAAIDADFQVTLKETIDEPQIYEAASALRYRYGASTEKEVLAVALETDPAANPRTAEAAEALKAAHPDDEERLDALIRYFEAADLTYTLHPEPLDLNHSTDSFLFDRKAGYCVHFAGAFVTMARLAGLPARIVTGYKGNPANSVERYLAVEEQDAHAWAEVLVKGAWRRVETTATASRVAGEISTATATTTGEGERKSTKGGLAKANLYLLYAQYRIETWILRYSRFRQMQLLEKAKKTPIFVVKFAGSLLLVVLAALLAAAYLRREPCGTTPRCLMKPLLEKLEKSGCTRQPTETMHAFLLRCAANHPERERLLEIDTLYHEILYGEAKEKEKALKRAIGEFPG